MRFGRPRAFETQRAPPRIRALRVASLARRRPALGVPEGGPNGSVPPGGSRPGDVVKSGCSVAGGVPEIPREFVIDRKAALGRHRMHSVFEGLTEVPVFARYPGSASANRRVARSAWVRIVDESTWMYVAPRRPPPFAKVVGWKPVLSTADCIVVGRNHLRRSSSLVLYMDVIHEFTHLLQRRAGRDLWDLSRGYVGSPTELEAYRLCVGEARRLGASDTFLRKYLKLEWVSDADHRRLLRALKVPER